MGNQWFHATFVVFRHSAMIRMRIFWSSDRISGTLPLYPLASHIRRLSTLGGMWTFLSVQVYVVIILKELKAAMTSTFPQSVPVLTCTVILPSGTRINGISSVVWLDKINERRLTLLE